MIAQPGKYPVALAELHERAEAFPRSPADQFDETHKRLPQRSLAPPPLPGKAAVLLKGVSAFSEPGVFRPFLPGAFSRRGEGARALPLPTTYLIPQNPRQKKALWCFFEINMQFCANPLTARTRDDLETCTMTTQFS